MKRLDTITLRALNARPTMDGENMASRWRGGKERGGKERKGKERKENGAGVDVDKTRLKAGGR